jgi:hypothetical protein
MLASHYPDHEISRARLLFDLGPDPEEGSYRLWHGHFGLGDALDHVPADTRFVTAVRHPVERVRSLYHFWRDFDLSSYDGTPETDPNHAGLMLAATGSGLDEFLATDNLTIRREISDAQTRYLSGRLMDPGPVTAATAIDQIERREILVVRQDRFAADAVAAVESLFGVVLDPGRIGFLNRQRYDAPLTPAQRTRITELNPADLELWHHLTATDAGSATTLLPV